MIFSYAYRSIPTASAEDFERDLDGIFSMSRVRNVEHGVTGALLASERAFVQIVEGDQSAVTALMNNIRHDARNDTIETLLTEFRSDRRFAGWAMARIDKHNADTDAVLDELSFSGPDRVQPLIERMAELVAA